MAKSTGGDLVLQLLQESREHQQDYQQFKREMLEFKQDYRHFKQEMLSFKEVSELRMNLLHQGLVQSHDYLKLIVKMLQDMGDVRQRVSQHDEQLADHEHRLSLLEK